MKNWTWKALAAGERRPDKMLNASGLIVRYHAPHPTRSAIERFFDRIEEVETAAGVCWRWLASDQFWVRGQIVISPWRYSYELLIGAHVPRGANFRWLCSTPRCCQPEHLEMIGIYCAERLR